MVGALLVPTNASAMFASEAKQDVAQLYRDAQRGDAKAQLDLCLMLSSSEVAPQNRDAAAATWCRRAADQGNAAAQRYVGFFYRWGQGLPQDCSLAQSWWTKAANQGDLLSQYNLALMFAAGTCVAKSDGQAAFWMSKAADQGMPEALDSLGTMYNNGLGVLKDDAKALALWRQAAEKGYVEAQRNMGYVYELGAAGAPKDYVQALFWYRKAADAGDAEAQHNVSVYYTKGQGVPIDNAQASVWMRKAAEQNYASSQFNLGLSYLAGIGVPLDIEAAYMWLNLATANAKDSKDVEEYGSLRDRAAGGLTREQVASVQQRTREWLEAYRARTEQPAAGGLVSDGLRIRLVADNGTFKVPVQINGVLTLNFTVDSGAADVSIPADVALTLVRTGTIQDSDFIGEQHYQLADGSVVKSARFKISSLKVGNQTVADVVGSISDSKGPLLLGQSFLSRFRSWSIDNTTRDLVLVPR